MTDRLAEMKKMVLDVARRLKGDDFMIGLIQNIETSMKLISEENPTLAHDDMITLEKNLNELVSSLHSCSNDMYNYSTLVSTLQLKYSEDTPYSKKNIKNINKELDRYEKNVLLKNNKIGE
tara:strand:- start:226 stop:588 length:363 start_codon:yes stop_codon:yes gene_type:complete